jgi:hypothetical protein
MILINLIRDPSQMGHESKVIDLDHLHHDPSQNQVIDLDDHDPSQFWYMILIMTHFKSSHDPQ